MVTKIQGGNGFSRTLGAAKDQIRRKSLQPTTNHPATTPISIGDIERQ